jgi:DnaJ-class molecular chaperone
MICSGVTCACSNAMGQRSTTHSSTVVRSFAGEATLRDVSWHGGGDAPQNPRCDHSCRGTPWFGHTPGETGRTQLSPHPLLHVLDEGDMEIELPVAPWEAALGAKVRVPTIEGAVDMTVPAGAQGGQRLRLRGQGVQRRGDQYVRLKLVNPPTLTDSERALFEQLAAASRFNPRELMKG